MGPDDQMEYMLHMSIKDNVSPTSNDISKEDQDLAAAIQASLNETPKADSLSDTPTAAIRDETPESRGIVGPSQSARRQLDKTFSNKDSPATVTAEQFNNMDMGSDNNVSEKGTRRSADVPESMVS